MPAHHEATDRGKETTEPDTQRFGSSTEGRACHVQEGRRQERGQQARWRRAVQSIQGHGSPVLKFSTKLVQHRERGEKRDRERQKGNQRQREGRCMAVIFPEYIPSIFHIDRGRTAPLRDSRRRLPPGLSYPCHLAFVPLRTAIHPSIPTKTVTHGSSVHTGTIKRTRSTSWPPRHQEPASGRRPASPGTGRSCECRPRP